MRNLPLYKRSNKYFKELGIVQKGKKSRKTIRYIVQRTYESLPKRISKYMEDPAQQIESLTNMIMAGEDKINPFKAMTHTAQSTKRAKSMGTREELYREFRAQNPSVYAKYNSYMYRQGYSARNYWFDNMDYVVDENYIRSFCELPKRIQPTGKKRQLVQYNVLEIILDKSGGGCEAYLH